MEGIGKCIAINGRIVLSADCPASTVSTLEKEPRSLYRCVQLYVKGNDASRERYDALAGVVQGEDCQQIILDVAGHQKILFDVLVTVFPHALAQPPVAQ